MGHSISHLGCIKLITLCFTNRKSSVPNDCLNIWVQLYPDSMVHLGFPLFTLVSTLVMVGTMVRVSALIIFGVAMTCMGCQVTLLWGFVLDAVLIIVGGTLSCAVLINNLLNEEVKSMAFSLSVISSLRFRAPFMCLFLRQSCGCGM